jgi:ABC-type dipeptide/oligopeptide/nickel transport system permease subunit
VRVSLVPGVAYLIGMVLLGICVGWRAALSYRTVDELLREVQVDDEAEADE